MIYTLTLNPSIDKTVYVDDFEKNKLNKVKEVFYSAGGKGINVSKTIKAYGEESIALGFIGGHNGRFIKDKLDELSVKNDFVEINGNCRENVKVIDGDKLTEINEKGPCVSEDDIDRLIDKIKKHISKNDILVISGSVCLGVNNDIYLKIIEIVNSCGGKAILDADNDLFKLGIKAKPYAIKPNTLELCKYFGVEETDDISALKENCLKLIDMGTNEVLLSMGSKGALYVDRNTCFKVEPLNIDVKSTVGAGDAMVAALALCINKSIDVEEKIKMAVAFGSGACLSKGTEPPSVEIINDLKQKVIIKSY